MSILLGFIVAALIGTSTYFGTVKYTKMNCEKNGYFVYVNEDGVAEKHKCE